jgi:transcriptional regulator with XRE-family HTH domain
MKTGEKIASERRQINYTQEQLADYMEVTRQTVSKWESDLAYPETDKIIKLAGLFHCTTDYLLCESVTDRGTKSGEAGSSASLNLHFDLAGIVYEHKSKKSLWGLPLIDVNWGLRRKARGIIAVGIRAEGVVSIGMIPVGVFSFGVLPLGLFSVGAIALGLLFSCGAVCLGAFAVGAVAIGLLAKGAVAVGLFSEGALAVARYGAIGDRAYGMVTSAKTYSAGTYFNETSPSMSFSDSAKKALQEVVPSVWAWLMNWFLAL